MGLILGTNSWGIASRVAALVKAEMGAVKPSVSTYDQLPKIIVKTMIPAHAKAVNSNTDIPTSQSQYPKNALGSNPGIEKYSRIDEVPKDGKLGLRMGALE